jgi:DNA-binding CsgD family transcriptional regulator
MRTVGAMLAANRGDLSVAVAIADEDIATSLELGITALERNSRGVRGFCALVEGDYAAAVANLERYMELFGQNNSVEPALPQYFGDHVEALVAMGRLDDAELAIAAMVEPATRLGRTAVLAAAARVEALLLAERGDFEAAIVAAARSVELYDVIERRFDRARAVLTKGQIHRRYKQKASARRDLTVALAEFEAVGAAGFAAKTRAELQRIGLRPPASDSLTETERQIAELTATGLTSAEVGQQLFLATKTVSSSLTRIYRKLGIRNRAELAAGMKALERD